jgi:hypothetical protein
VVTGDSRWTRCKLLVVVVASKLRWLEKENIWGEMWGLYRGGSGEAQ